MNIHRKNKKQGLLSDIDTIDTNKMSANLDDFLDDMDLEELNNTKTTNIDNINNNKTEDMNYDDPDDILDDIFDGINENNNNKNEKKDDIKEIKKNENEKKNNSFENKEKKENKNETPKTNKRRSSRLNQFNNMNNRNEMDEMSPVGDTLEDEEKNNDIEMGKFNNNQNNNQNNNNNNNNCDDLDLPIPTFGKQHGLKKYMNKGDISNFVSLIIMIIGIILNAIEPDNIIIDYILAAGLFGFAGGTTNWLAVKMLFDRIPFLIGSGVIPRQFKAIRETVKNTIMKTFFDSEYLTKYIDDNTEKFIGKLNLSGRLNDIINSPTFDKTLIENLKLVSEKPEGAMLKTMAPMMGGFEKIGVLLKPMILEFGKQLGSQIGNGFNIQDHISIPALRKEINDLMTVKMEILTPETVKELLEEVIREHLGWLIVWGNVFGGIIGIVALAAGYG